MSALAELERRRMDHSLPAQPGTPRYATETLNRLAPTPQDAAGYVPGLGDAADAVGAYNALREGNWGEAALFGGAMALPFVTGPMIKGWLRHQELKNPVGSVPIGQEQSLMELATTLNDPLLAEYMAARGIKRHPLYYHGTKGGQDSKQAILDEGFKYGQSSELQLPGTSVSEDPLVSRNLFTSWDSPNRDADIMGVDVQVPPSDVYNLSPSEYANMSYPDEQGAVYRKPGMFFREAETFGTRPKKQPDWQNLENQIEEKYREVNSLTDAAAKIRFDVAQPQNDFVNKLLNQPELTSEQRRAISAWAANGDRHRAIRAAIDQNAVPESMMDEALTLREKGDQLENALFRYRTAHAEYNRLRAKQDDLPEGLPQLSPREMNEYERRNLEASKAAWSRVGDFRAGDFQKALVEANQAQGVMQQATARRVIQDYASAFTGLRGNRAYVHRELESLAPSKTREFWDLMEYAYGREGQEALYADWLEWDRAVKAAKEAAKQGDDEPYRYAIKARDNLVKSLTGLRSAGKAKPNLPR